jgi:hypothetical protein
MPGKISFVIPCEAQWVEGIYRIETTDRVLGYDPATGDDGVANRQWKELGDRTLYLRALGQAAHSDGRHSLTDADFVPETRIPESALKLDYGTAALQGLIAGLRADTQTARRIIEQITDVNLSYASVLTVLVPYSREYFRTNCDYELFMDGIKMRSFSSTGIVREISGDDSLDVESTEGVEVGKTYILMGPGGEDVEEVTVLSVLTEHRLRFTASLTKTRSSGYMASTSLLPSNGEAVVTRPFVYLSDKVDTLSDAAYGNLYVHRDNVEATGKVYYCLDGSSVWHLAEYVGNEHFLDGSIDDVFRLPAGIMKLRIEYSSATYPWKLYYFVLKAVEDYVVVEDVRRPVIESVEIDGRCVVATGDAYASLWDIPQDAVEIRVSLENEYKARTARATIYGGANRAAVTLPYDMAEERPLRVQLRYKDIEGTFSRWSSGYVIRQA